MSIPTNHPDTSSVKLLADTLTTNVEQVIFGKTEVIRKVVLCLLTGGHLLLEDIPGTGKTTLAKTLARSLTCDCTRVQFTPDLLPSDLTGIKFYNQKEQEFTFKPGAIFTNILLGDEINRATPRTQSSLLECMEERQVTVDGVTHKLDAPFFVIATQNPIEIQGTFPLPEAQLDRFLMRVSMGYPSLEFERRMLTAFSEVSPLDSIKPVADIPALLEAQAICRRVFVSESIADYIVRISEASRTDEALRLGVSPRGSLALLHAAQTYAAMDGRGYLLPDDVKAICADVLCHRIICKGARTSQSVAIATETLRRILLQVAIGTEN